MTLRDEIRQFMTISEDLLDGSLKAEDLSNIEYEVLQFYVMKIAEKFPALILG